MALPRLCKWLAPTLAPTLIAAGAVAAHATGSTAAANDYSADASWLCRPGRQDACAVDLSTTVVGADGSLTVERFAPDPDPPIDCFYVYPTVSLDPGPV